MRPARSRPAAAPRAGRLARWAGVPTSVRRRALNRLLLRLPLAPRRRVQYLLAHGTPLHLRRPQRWSEKVNWRIVHDRRPLIAMTCDKEAAKDFVRSVAAAGTVRVPATVWCGADPSALAGVDWPARWVFKSNHGTGAVEFGEGRPDPSRLAQLGALGRLWLDDRGLERWGEWGYAQARRLLLVEEAIPGTPAAGLPDYKFFVTGGRVQLIQVDVDRFTDHRRRFYTPTWQPVDAVCEVPTAPLSAPPCHLTAMVDVATRLGAAFDAVRVDLYDSAGEVWFGELTAYSGSGLAPLRPASLDLELGASWDLPSLDGAGARLRA